jgi:hypothetical protein
MVHCRASDDGAVCEATAESVRVIYNRAPYSAIELGAGHSVYGDPTHLARVKAALAQYRNIVLLLPSADTDEWIRILNTRQGNPHREIVQMNTRFVKHPSNHELATITVYTEGKTPEATCQEILSRLFSASGSETWAERR